MIKFGTSGFRGIMADNFTKENVMKVAYAITEVAKTKDEITVGFDNRFMGKYFAMWVSEVLVAYGKKVRFFNIPVPSPLVAFESKNNEFGIMITASHNPYYYNGIKIFQKGGSELTSEQNEKIEKIANKKAIDKILSVPFEQAVKNKKIVLTEDLSNYVFEVMNSIDKSVINKNKFKLICNFMHGSAILPAKKIFWKLGINTGYINADVNPNFNFSLPAPYEKNLNDQKELAKLIRDENFGFALDGDGDRISFVDEKGNFYDCNYIVALIYENMLLSGQKTDIVKNCAMTSLIDKIADAFGQKVVLAKVGFKNTAKEMKSSGAFLGAESNGIAFKNHLPYKDGLFCAVKLCETVAKSSQPFSEMIKNLKKKYHFPCVVHEYAYPTTDLQKQKITQKVFENKKLPKFSQKIVSTSYADGLKIIFEGGYWCVIRFSGNENVLRLFAEMKNEKECKEVIAILEKFVGLHIRQD